MIVAAVLIVASVASAKPIEIKFWTLFTGGDGEFFDAMVKEFNASQSEIVAKNDTVKFSNYYTKLTAALAAMTAPDIVICHTERFVNYVPNGRFLALDSYAKQIGMDLSTYQPSVLDACKYKGKLYAIPMDVHPIVMYYNKDLLAKAGVTKVPVSLDELLAAATAVKEKTGAIGIVADNTTATYKAYTLSRMFYSMLKEQGYDFLNASCTKANFNNDAGVKAYNALNDMVNKLGVTPKGLDYDTSCADFKLGKAGFHFNGVWMVGSFSEQKDLKFGVCEFPALFGKNASWCGSHTFAIPVQKRQDPKKVVAAMKFINWMTEHGELWAKAGQMPTRMTVYQKDSFKSIPHISEYLSAAEHTFTVPATPKWDEIYDATSDCLEEAVAKNKDAKTALADMEKVINGILSK